MFGALSGTWNLFGYCAFGPEEILITSSYVIHWSVVVTEQLLKGLGNVGKKYLVSNKCLTIVELAFFREVIEYQNW